MSILINGMEMPKSCRQCSLYLQSMDSERNVYENCAVTAKSYNWGLTTRPSDCPLAPVPPHGRLGDLNSLAERLEDLRKTTAKENPPTDNHGFINGIMCGIGVAINEVRYYTPTIIPAEEGE